MDKAINALRVGATDFITRPVRLLELDAALEKTVRFRRLVIQRMRASTALANRNEKLLTEIDRRKKAEGAMQKSSSIYHLIAENVSDIILETDADLRFTYISPAVTRMLGYSVDEAMALTWEELLSPESMGVFSQTHVQKLMSGEMPAKNPLWLQKLKLKLIRKDGSTVSADSKFSSLHDPDGNPAGVLGILSITAD
jgi:PAS domain S-box-containing protein